MIIPPHLTIAEAITEQEYESAKIQSRKLNVITIVGFIIGIPLGYLYFVHKIALAESEGDVRIMVKALFRPIFITMFSGFIARGIAMRSYCKDAYKLRTLAYKRYPELREFKKRNQKP